MQKETTNQSQSDQKSGKSSLAGPNQNGISVVVERSEKEATCLAPNVEIPPTPQEETKEFKKSAGLLQLTSETACQQHYEGGKNGESSD